MSWTLSNKYIYEIYKGREMHRYYTQADTLLSICYCWRSTFMTKIDMKIYFRCTLIRSPQCRFWCMAGALYECAPNFSYPAFPLQNMKNLSSNLIFAFLAQVHRSTRGRGSVTSPSQSSLLMCSFLLRSPLNVLFLKEVHKNVHENQQAKSGAS